VISAYSQTSFGGIAGSPVTTLYIIRIKALRSFTLVADSIFAENRIEAFRILKDSFHLSDTCQMKKGMVIELTVSIRKEATMGGGDHQELIPGSRITEPPFAPGNGVLVRYRGGKSKYLLIKTVQKKPDLLMP
jgi:hypothetical protein